MFDLRRFVAVTAAIAILATAASAGLLAVDAPTWGVYVASAVLTGLGVFQLLMPGRGLRLGTRSLDRPDRGSTLTR